MISQNLIAWILDEAQRMGLDAADVLASEKVTRNTRVRLSKPEKVTFSNDVKLLVRLFSGIKTAAHFTSDLSREALREVLEKTKAMLISRDDSCGLADSEEYPVEEKNFGLYDPKIAELSIEDQIDLARRAENSAFEYDPRVKNIDQNTCVIFCEKIFYGSSRGFYGEYSSSAILCSIRVVAESSAGMQGYRYAYSSRFLSGLKPPEEIGRIAAKRAVGQLGGKKIRTRVAEVIFDPVEATRLLEVLSQAVSGDRIYQEKSFLGGKLGEVVASPAVTLIDDGTLPGHLGTRPFDCEGVRSRRKVVIDRGRLASYLLDTYHGRKLGMRTTGNCGGNSTIVPGNFFLERGEHSPEEIISSVKEGLYITEQIGFGVNLVTGDYSQGVRGIWIENGKLTYPVEEITIAGNLKEMLKEIVMVGNDLEFGAEIASPTIKIARMTIAGT